MKDRTKANTSTSAGDDGNVVELTPDMALQDQAQQKIINLTRSLGQQESETAPETVSRKPVAEAPTPKKAPSPPEQDASQSMQTHTGIEQEVDAAFDAVQTTETAEDEITDTAASTTAETDDDQLLDDLSALTERVDNAVQDAAEPEPAATASTEPSEAAEKDALAEPPAEIDEAQLALDAADVDAALSLDPEDEDVLELTDIVDPAELDTADSIQTDEEIIELTEIVDPAELEAGAPRQADEEVIDLSEIVDPATLKADDAEPEEEVLELSDIVEPAELGAPEDADQAPPPTQEAEELIELTDIIENKEQQAIAQPEENEELIQLSDVLGHEKDADDDQDQPVDELPQLDDDETAINLGLEMEAESTEENDLLTEKELEEAMERLFQNKYAGTIEQLVSSAVEKAVGQQFEELKRAIAGNKDTPE